MVLKRLAAVAGIFLCLLVNVPMLLASEVDISVASSMKDAFNEIEANYLRQHPGARIIPRFGTSEELALQISKGTAADLFITSHDQWTNYLKLKNLLEEMFSTVFATNALVVVGRDGTQAFRMADLAAMKRIAIGNPNRVANAQYAMEALKNAGLDKQMADRIVIGKNNSDILRLIDNSEVDGAIIYHTAAVKSKQVKILFTVPANLYTPIIYKLVLTKSGLKKKEVVDFYKFLTSESSKHILQKFGFTVI
jgi:molybdate transport system substrate-binding protein